MEVPIFEFLAREFTVRVQWTLDKYASCARNLNSTQRPFSPGQKYKMLSGQYVFLVSQREIEAKKLRNCTETQSAFKLDAIFPWKLI